MEGFTEVRKKSNKSGTRPAYYGSKGKQGTQKTQQQKNYKNDKMVTSQKIENGPSKDEKDNMNIRGLLKREKFNDKQKALTYDECKVFLKNKTQNTYYQKLMLFCWVIWEYNVKESFRTIFNIMCTNGDINPERLGAKQIAFYSPFNKVMWWNNNASEKYVTNVVKELHKLGFHIFEDNKDGETVLDSLYAKKNYVKDSISYENFEFRYCCIVDGFSEKEAESMVLRICNKGNVLNQKFIDQLRFVIAKYPEIAIKKLVENWLFSKLKTIKDGPHTEIGNFINLFLSVINGADNNYQNMNNNSSVKFYFTKHKTKSEQELLQMCFDAVCDIGIYSTKNDVNYTEIEVSFAILGELSKRKYFIKESDKIVTGFLDEKKGTISMVDGVNAFTFEDSIKCATRYITQYGKYDMSIIELLSHLYLKGNLNTYSKTRIWITLEIGLGKIKLEDKIKQWASGIDANDILPKKEENNLKSEIDESPEISITLKIKPEKMGEKISALIEKFNKLQVSEAIFSSILENFTKFDINEINPYVDEIKKHIDKAILKSSLVDMRDFLNEFEKDNPFAKECFRKLEQLV